jgi:hypothetical protein
MIAKKKTKLNYVIGKGYHVGREQAESLFALIRDEFDGEKPTPDELVKRARRCRRRYPGLFEWDDRKAASEQRRTAAQYYLRAIHLVVVDVKTDEIVKGPVRAFVPVKVERCHRIPPSNYVPAQRLPDEPESIDAVLEMAREDFRRVISRYERYAEFVDVFDPVIKAFRQLDKRHLRPSAKVK